MKPALLISLTSLLVGLSLYTEFKAEPNTFNFSHQKATVADSLQENDLAVKTLYHHESQQIYWLSYLGKLYTTSQEDNQHTLISHNQSDWKDVTFIEDFCLNHAKDSIFFTDLMDLESGKSAIKVTDLKGKNVKTLAQLKDEIPYQLTMVKDQAVLFYLSKKMNKRQATFLLRFIDLSKGQSGTLYASNQRMEQLQYDLITHEVLVKNQQKQTFAFSAATQNIQTLTAAFKPE